MMGPHLSTVPALAQTMSSAERNTLLRLAQEGTSDHAKTSEVLHPNGGSEDRIIDSCSKPEVEGEKIYDLSRSSRILPATLIPMSETQLGKLGTSEGSRHHSSISGSPQVQLKNENGGNSSSLAVGHTDTLNEKKSQGKLDRSKLRKGKWTVEEEEFAARIIHHFSTGRLTLPDGTTLRSYLADKLNCDPMRITKKFAGASCLGKRVYHLCDRSRHSVSDVELAKAELAHLETRFHLRVEHGQAGIPLPFKADLLPALPIGSSIYNPNMSLTSTPWLQNLASLSAAVPAPSPGSLLGLIAAAPVPLSAQHGPKLIAPNPSQSVLSPETATSMNPLAPPGTNNALASLAWAQAVSSLTPALSQLANANMKQNQKQLQAAVASQMQAAIQQQQLRKAYETQLQKQVSSPGTVPASPELVVPHSPKNSTRLEASVSPRTSPARVPAVTKTKSSLKAGEFCRPSPTRSKEDQDAGSALLGFISSLRQSFEEAKARRQEEEASLVRTETSSGTTTNPADSSLDESELSENDKAKEFLSASEESDKEGSGMQSRLGPPRKRLKTRHSSFTRRNVAEHTSRMSALHAEEEKRKDCR